MSLWRTFALLFLLPWILAWCFCSSYPASWHDASVPLTLPLGMLGSLLSSWFRCRLLRETFSDHHATPQSKTAPPLALYCISLLKTPITVWNHLHFSMDVLVKCAGCELLGGLDSTEVVPTVSPALKTKGYLSRATLLNEWVMTKAFMPVCCPPASFL